MGLNRATDLTMAAILALAAVYFMVGHHGAGLVATSGGGAAWCLFTGMRRRD